MPSIVRIRLSLRGCTNRPFYHIVVANSRWKRDGKHLEQVGSYDPMPNHNKEIVVGLNLDRIKYWLSVGAQPSVAVYKLLGMAGILPAHPRLVLEAKRQRDTLNKQAETVAAASESNNIETSSATESTETDT